MEGMKDKIKAAEALVTEIKALDTEGQIAAAAFAQGVKFALGITGAPEPEPEKKSA